MGWVFLLNHRRGLFFSSLELEPGIPAKNELNRVWLSPSVHPYKEPILVQSGVDSLTTSSANRDLLERVIESSLIPRLNFANRLVKARKRSARHEIPCQEGLAPSQPYLGYPTLKRFNERLLSLVF